jgi:hypothetical protein
VKTNNKFYYFIQAQTVNCCDKRCYKKIHAIKVSNPQTFLISRSSKSRQANSSDFHKRTLQEERRRDTASAIHETTNAVRETAETIKGATQQVKDAAPETIEIIRKASSSRKKLKRK